MNAYTRLLTSLALVAFGLAGVAWMRPAWASALGLDWGDLAQLREVHEAELGRGAELDRRLEVLYRRVAAKEGVVEQLLAGRTTLLEAAAWFRLLNEHPADCQDEFRRWWRGKSDGEKLCRQVISWVVMELHARGPADLAEAQRRRLEAELQAHLRRDGTVHLPEIEE